MQRHFCLQEWALSHYVLIMSEAVRDLFTRISPTYDKLNHLLSFNIDKRWRKKALRGCHLKNTDVKNVLDLCAGTLDFSIMASAHFPQARIDALDFSEGMLERGRSKIALQNLDKRIFPVCADALHTPYADNLFDVVMCAYGLRNLDDKRAGSMEMLRLLKPGGELIILEFFRPQNMFSRIFNKTYAEIILPTVGGVVSGDRKAYAYLRDSIRRFLTVDEYKNTLTEIGYTGISHHHFFGGISSVVRAHKKA